MADSKHTAIMANTWSTTIPKAKRERRVGGRLVEIDYSEYMNWYYFGRHAVDDNNNNRQGQLSFEETFTPDRWELQHLSWLIGLTQVNSMLAFNFFNRKPQNKTAFTKAAFTRIIAKDLIHTQEDSPIQAKDDEGYTPPITRGPKVLPAGAKFKLSVDPNPHKQHHLCVLRKCHGQWNGNEFPTTSSDYPKSHCKVCSREMRTFCYCNWGKMMCAQCHGMHLMEIATIK